MMKRFLSIVSVAFACAAFMFAQNNNQNSNSGATTRTRTVEPKPSPQKRSTGSETSGTQSRPKPTPVAPSTGVLAAFDKIIEGIRRSNVDLYTSGYWNSPSLILFNYNGTVTKGWEQLRKNRESSFPESKDVKLDIRDRHVVMLGRDGAVVSCLWTQT